jgi:signal transduction histidine kinase
MKPDQTTPSIARRLSLTLWLWFLFFSVAVGLAVWQQTHHEVEELLDDTLIAAADVIKANLPAANTITALASQPPILPGTETPEQRFAWQWVSDQGVIQARSLGAPQIPWRASSRLGLFDADEWRVYGMRVDQAEGTLYVAQVLAERFEASLGVAIGAVLAVLGIGIAGQFWLRRRIASELAPIKALSERMLRWNANRTSGKQRPWGLPEREELQPIHTALDALSTELDTQIAQERAFSAHTSHALRTPLSGIDTQLAVALRETDAHQASLRVRLEKIRQSTQRMQRVVESLLTLFRYGGEVQRETIQLNALLDSLSLPPKISVIASSDDAVHANVDLLSAALFNLLDNALRYGAQTVQLSVTSTNTLHIKDDGAGVSVERLQALQANLKAQTEGEVNTVGMGLWLAQRVAHAHGGQLSIASVEGHGLTVTLHLGTSV